RRFLHVPGGALTAHHSSMMARWRGRCDRRACGDVAEPIAQLRVPRPPVKIGNPSFEPEGTGKRDLCQVECAAHQRMVDLYLPEITHSSTAVCFELDDCGRTLVLRS